MRRTGFTELPLHGGRAPPWLVGRMKKLAGPIVTIILDEYGRKGLLKRLSSPCWFQALGCVLGYDWHSSGLTTVTSAVLKQVLDPEEHGIFVAGGKGKSSLNTPNEIDGLTKTFELPQEQIEDLKRASRLSAKIDNTAIQAGAPLYHHAFFVTEDRKWAVIQQGMNAENRTARRYHWISDHVTTFVDEPHEAIVAEKKEKHVLDMTAKTSKNSRKTSTDLVKDNPTKIKRDFKSLRPPSQRSLHEWMPGSNEENREVQFLSMPKRMNWRALEKAYELQPENYENLLSIRGIGPATVRGLALVSEIIYGDPPSWRDPAKFSYAFGGKDSIPYPVDKKAMDEAHHALKSAVEEAEIGHREKLKALERLYSIEPEPSRQH
ncbi:hypothetical protein AKJ45_01485 [candidate division MSBL1 archaeon SCGC-AAA261F19]|uniref:DUF763 domain-containing protein n=1 Tax=candidate division MSBL1 archaeon SCGC-AAA261F19 TaxID=1698275 RepID=A0A133VAP8_9EURY|nr:hypothetical protein AKJ45_01485 [candidate division MSBL1 archaeon SCGC-AAA261F19]